METKIRARVQSAKNEYIHNDLSQAATYFDEVIEEKREKR